MAGFFFELECRSLQAGSYMGYRGGSFLGRLDERNQVDLPVSMSTKELAYAAIKALPDDATMQDAADKLTLLAALEKSRENVKTGHWKPQAEVERLLPQWLEK